MRNYIPITNINNINLYYETCGEGPDLILIGGLTTNHSIWSLMVEDLAKYFHVITIDNRGAGQSSQPSGGYTIDDMTNDVAALIDHCHIKSAFLVGTSLGGAITQKLCINHPVKVKAAIIVGSILIDAGVSQDLILETVFPWIYGNSFLEDPAKIEAEMQHIKNDPHPQTYEGYIGQVDSLLYK